MAIGANAVADQANTVSVGSAGNERRITNVAAGTAGTDAVNVSQLNAAVTAGTNNVLQQAVLFNGPNGEANASGKKLINVAAGTVNTDAVNVGQLSSVVSTLGGGASVNADGGITAPAYHVQNGTQNTVGDALSTLDGAVNNLGTRIDDMSAGSQSAIHHLSTDGAMDGSDDAHTAPGQRGVALGASANSSGDHATAIGADSSAGGANATALGGNALAVGPNDTAIGGNAKVHADGSVAVGANSTVAATATNAVAVGADSSVTAASATAIGQGASAAANGSVALGQGSVADRDNTVSVGSATNTRQITNLAAGTQGTDAVNINQLTTQTQQAIQTAQSYTDASSRQALQSANAYTDQKVQNIGNALTNLQSQVNDQFKQQSKRIDQTGAMGAAMTQMAVNTAGLKTDNRLGAGIGGQGSQTALSVGYQRVLNREGSATLSVGGSVSNGGNAAFGVGAGFGW